MSRWNIVRLITDCPRAPRNLNNALLFPHQEEFAYESGLHSDFCALSIPSWFLEKVKWTSQCNDFSKFSTSLIVLDSSRTINLPPGLTILSISAITGSILHLPSQMEYRWSSYVLWEKDNGQMKYQRIYPTWLPLFQPWKKMISMQEIIGSWVRAEGFTPVTIYPKETPFKDYGQCIWRVYVHHIQDPHLKVL